MRNGLPAGRVTRSEAKKWLRLHLMEKKKWQGLLSIIFVMLIWGSSFAVTRVAVATMPPLTFAFLRFLVASFVLLPALLMRAKSMPAGAFRGLPWGTLSGMGLTGIAIYFYFFNLSLKNIPAATGALIQGFIPVCIALLAAVFLKERLTWRQSAGILLSIAGVVAIGFFGDRSAGGPSGTRGSLYMIFAVLSWGIYTILSKKLSRIPSLLVISFTTFIGTGMLFLLACYENRLTGFPPVPAATWGAILYLGVLGSALGYFLYSRALESLSAVMVGNFINLDPVIGLGIAILFLHERINLAQAAGGMLVLTGIVLSTSAKKTPG